MTRVKKEQEDFKNNYLDKIKDSGGEVTNLLQAILITLEEIKDKLPRP